MAIASIITRNYDILLTLTVVALSMVGVVVPVEAQTASIREHIAISDMASGSVVSSIAVRPQELRGRVAGVVITVVSKESVLQQSERTMQGWQVLDTMTSARVMVELQRRIARQQQLREEMATGEHQQDMRIRQKSEQEPKEMMELSRR
jgi:hypothetical protein